MKSIGIIGSGQMGAGIAQVSAQAGYHVYLSDMNQEIAEKGKAGIAKQLSRLVDKEKMEQQVAQTTLDRIETIGSLDPMASADIIIEAATEREDIKRQIFGAASEVLGHQSLMATTHRPYPSRDWHSLLKTRPVSLVCIFSIPYR